MINIKKGIINIFVVTTMIFLLVSCQQGSYTIINGKLSNSGNTYSGQYDSFSGYYEYSLGQHKDMDLNYKINTKGGKLTIYVVDGKGNIIAESKDESSGKMEVRLREKQKLALKVHGNNHNGSYDIEKID